MHKYMHIFRAHYINNEKGRVEKKICFVHSAESEEIYDNLFFLENSKIHTNIAKVCVLEVLQIILSFTIEISRVKEKQSL